MAIRIRNKFQLYEGTHEELTNSRIVFKQTDEIFATDTKKRYFGDGEHEFPDLKSIDEGGGGGGGDADTLQGQNGAYYRNRANHTGSQAISTVTGLQTALNAKADTSSLGTAAAADVGAFATSTQGSKADTAIQSIGQGSNITVDNTDPLNPVISATGELSGTKWGDITGTLSDQTDLSSALGAKADASSLSGYVPTSRTVNAQALSGNVTLSASDVGAVPTARTVNGKALSANISLTNTDVGAAATSHTHAAADVTSGTFDDARIPNLNASKINAGTLADARIPSLNASKTNAGTFDAARIPDLATSKITGLDTALSGKLDVGTGTQNSSTFRRGDGTWATPTDTTYSAISQTDIENPASTTAGLITGQRLSQGIAHKSNNLVTIVGESGSTLNYGLNHIGLDKVVRTTGGGNKTHTIVPQGTTAWPDGSVIQLATPSSEVTIEAGSGVNIIASKSAPWVIAANTMATIIRLGSNEWILAAEFKVEE